MTATTAADADEARRLRDAMTDKLRHRAGIRSSPWPDHYGDSPMDDTRPWRQVNITFPDWAQAEPIVLAHLAPHLAVAEAEGAVDAWFFIRKRPCWQVRYLPAASGAADHIGQHLDELTASGRIGHWTTAIYEPEVHAFGGVNAMAAAHCLFHCEGTSGSRMDVAVWSGLSGGLGGSLVILHHRSRTSRGASSPTHLGRSSSGAPHLDPWGSAGSPAS
ncbi:MAG: thiopeptide-type bacteriocin biosynthesis protein [Trebonia sp.]